MSQEKEQEVVLDFMKYITDKDVSLGYKIKVFMQNMKSGQIDSWFHVFNENMKQIRTGKDIYKTLTENEIQQNFSSKIESSYITRVISDKKISVLSEEGVIVRTYKLVYVRCFRDHYLQTQNNSGGQINQTF